jgi:putative ABC transport system substrate-binding protein
MPVSIGRRQFVSLLGGAAATWPLAAHAQQTERMRRIGVLQAYSEGDPEARDVVAAFVDGLRKNGWMEGTNLLINYRWGGSDAERVRSYAAELVGQRLEVIWSAGPIPTLPLKRATYTIPIVFTQIFDPVGSGFVTSLARRAATSPVFRSANSQWAGRCWRY